MQHPPVPAHALVVGAIFVDHKGIVNIRRLFLCQKAEERLAVITGHFLSVADDPQGLFVPGRQEPIQQPQPYNVLLLVVPQPLQIAALQRTVGGFFVPRLLDLQPLGGCQHHIAVDHTVGAVALLGGQEPPPAVAGAHIALAVSKVQSGAHPAGLPGGKGAVKGNVYGEFIMPVVRAKHILFAVVWIKD